MNLKVDDIDLKCPGISEGISITFKEAIKVCLETNKHPQGKLFTIEGEISQDYNLHWIPVTQNLFDAWSDHQETTELAACGIAVHIILSHTDYTVRKRSWKRTGFDYWLGIKNEPDNLFQNVAKLEVSGISRETRTNKPEYRTTRKFEQIERFKDKYPAPFSYVIVVEFTAPKSLVTLHDD